ncbi:MAG TPA: hypothetical protein VEI57_12670 [Nitrospirota bacterium]|nr:hypothetical protein [Nitrospirota bacterium]
MKLAIFILAIVLFITAAPAVSHSAENDRTASKRQLLQEKGKYEHTMEERLAKLGKQLDEINDKATVMTAHARKDMNQYLDDAKKKQKMALRKLQEIQKESAETWKKFVSEMDAAADSLSKAYEKAKAHLKE